MDCPQSADFWRGGSGSGGGASSWLGAGGGGGGYQWGNGGFLPGGNDPWGDNHANPYPGGGGTGYGSDDLPSYLEKMAIILDQAVAAIGTGSATVQQKAALYNRLSVLMEVADMVDRGGFYDRMAAVMVGIFNEAENDPIVTVSDAVTEGYVLATDLVNGTDAVRVQVFQTALLAVVNQVLIDRGVVATIANRAEFESMVSALLQLGRTYASLNPTLASDTATTTTPDFLDSLWRAQQPLNPTTAKPTAEIHAELVRGMAALSSLLAGVNNPIQALTFVNNLIQAATKVDVLKDDIHDAKFLRELVEFGFEVAKVNPSETTYSIEDSLSDFLNVLWLGETQWERQAQGGLNDFFEGLNTENDRLNALDFVNKLFNALKMFPDLQLQQNLHDLWFTSLMADWGAKYIASFNDQDLVVDDLDGFFAAVANSQYDQGILVASTDLGQVISSSSPKWLEWIKNTPGSIDNSIRYTHLSNLADIAQGPIEYSARTKYYLRTILEECWDWGVRQTAKVAFILGVSTHETQRFLYTGEQITASEASIAYDGRVDLMNDVCGDGFKYIGRGFIHLTGKMRYQYYTEHSVKGQMLDFLATPSLAAVPEYAAYIMLDYLVKGESSLGLDWVYTSTNTRPVNDAALGGCKETLPPNEGHRVITRQIYSINDNSLQWDGSSASFANVASFVNQYQGTARDEVVNFSKRYLNYFKLF